MLNERPQQRAGTLFPALLAAAAACGAADRADAPAATATRDSAGIIIVENRAVPRLEEHGWHIADSPAVVVGRADGDPGDLLHRVFGAIRLHDGRIVVANGGSSELRFYDAQGRYLSAAGRSGGGPGEFQSLGSVHAYGDSLLAYDGRQRRVSVFDTAGRFLRSFQLEVRDGQSAPVLLGPLDAGRLAVRTLGARDTRALTTGVSRRPNTFWIHDAHGAILDSITTVPGWTAFSLVEPDALSITNVPIPFSPVAVAAAGPGRLALADTERPEYRVYDAAGGLERIVRWTPPLPPREVTAEDIEQLKAMAAEHAPPSRRSGLERLYDRMPFPQTRTPVNVIRLDARGCVWAIVWPGSGDDPPVATVFDATGRALGSLDLPRPLIIRDIGADYLLAGATDDLGVESVRLYTLVRAASC